MGNGVFLLVQDTENTTNGGGVNGQWRLYELTLDWRRNLTAFKSHKIVMDERCVVFSSTLWPSGKVNSRVNRRTSDRYTDVVCSGVLTLE